MPDRSLAALGHCVIWPRQLRDLDYARLPHSGEHYHVAIRFASMVANRYETRMPNARVPQFVRFLAVGVLNTAFSYAVFAALVWAGLPASVSLLLSTIMGIVFNFFTTGRLVFNNRDMRRLWRFLAAYGLVYLINLLSLNFVRSLGLPAVPAQGLCLLAMVPVSFVLQKLFVFGEIAHEDH